MRDAPLVAVNGSFLSQPITGVQRYAREALRAIEARLEGRYRIEVIEPAGARSRPAVAAWTQLGLPRLARRADAALLWSPANIGPLRFEPHVVTIFDASVFASPGSFSRAFRAYYRLLLPRLGRRAARVITISEFSRDELAAHGIAPRDRISVAPCGVSPAFRPDADRSAWASKAPYVLALGSRDPRKNLAALLRAWEQAGERARSGRALLVAGGAQAAFAREALPRAPQGVELLGYVPDEMLPGLYAGADAFVYPSLYEGFGLPPLEAMASGVPVLASRAASLPEACGDAATYCDPLDPASIARGIERVVLDQHLRALLRAKGLERAALHRWERTADCILAAFDEVLNSRGIG